MTFKDLDKYISNALKDFLNFEYSNKYYRIFSDYVAGVTISVQILYTSKVYTSGCPLKKINSLIDFSVDLTQNGNIFTIYGRDECGNYSFYSMLRDEEYGSFLTGSYKTVQEFEDAISKKFEVEPEKIYSKIEYLEE